jgi:hypothetical protein
MRGFCTTKWSPSALDVLRIAPGGTEATVVVTATGVGAAKVKEELSHLDRQLG